MKEQLGPMLAQLSNYGSLISSILLVMFGGMLAVFLFYRLARSLIQPGGSVLLCAQLLIHTQPPGRIECGYLCR
jgi:hypothetical protein